MILRSFLLADAVDVGSNGKAFIHGGAVSRLFAQQFPWVHPPIAVFARMQATADEIAREHHISIRVQGPADEPIAVATSPFRIGRPSDVELPPDVNFAMTFAGLRFAEPGLYHVVLEVDGTELDRLPLLVRDPP